MGMQKMRWVQLESAKIDGNFLIVGLMTCKKSKAFLIPKSV